MRIGYLFRGYLGDIKLDVDGNELSTPDGNATYSWSIEHECNRRGYKLIPLGAPLDEPAAKVHGPSLFSSFSQQKRALSYERMLRNGWTKLSDTKFPDLDIVLIEWRWPIPGRNTPEDRGDPHFQPDLDRQWEVIRHYSDLGVRLVIWDLDHKFTQADADCLSDAGIWFQVIETSVRPKPWAVRVEFPFVIDELLQHDIDDRMPSHHIGYIGSRYERDETIDQWIAPIAPASAHRVKFWGKWEPADDVKARWPGITFSGRIGVSGFYDAYSRVAAVPLLAKQSYYDCGFVTPRPWEAVLFGSIPIGLNCHVGIEDYCDRIAETPMHLLELATELRTVSPIRRRVMREEAAHKLHRMDVRHFVDVLERMAACDVEDDHVAVQATEEGK